MEVGHAALEWFRWKSEGAAWSAKHRSKVRRVVDRLHDFFAGREVASLDVGDLRLLEQAQVGRRSADALNFDRLYLVSFFAFARKNGWTELDPMSCWLHRKCEPDPDKVFTFYSKEERDALRRQIRADLRAFMQFSFVTGLRQSTVRLLKWKWLSREGVLCVPAWAVKNRMAIRQALPGELVLELGPRKRPEDLLFPDLPPWPQQIWKEFKKACRRAGVRDGRPHDMRRTMANNLANRGVPMSVIMRIGGWRSEKTVRRYYLTDVPDEDCRRYLEENQ